VRSASKRWEALDLLRGVTIIAMLLNLQPGSWTSQYSWIEHAKWEGGHLIDMVAPAFLFCIGAVMPLSFRRRLEAGGTKLQVAGHVLWRSLVLIVLGLLINAYPDFDLPHTRIPGVLQRIGLTYGIAGLFLLATARRRDGRARFPIAPVVGAIVVILASYWALLEFVPVPGFGAPRFDPVGSWPPVVDRAVIGVNHMFKYWPVNGKVVFDPEGILSTWPATASVLLGVLAGLVHAQGRLGRPVLTALVALGAGAALMGASVALASVCPVIKNIWTPTFALFSAGFALVLLAIFTAVAGQKWIEPLAFPARVFGSNPILAYVLCFAAAPAIDFAWIAQPKDAPMSLRDFGQAQLSAFMAPEAASLTFGLIFLVLLGLLLWVFYRRGWLLKI
jgi:predicted acyltransferase